MRHLLFALMLAGCASNPPDENANLCPTERDRTAECASRCAAGPDTETCIPGWEAVCTAECNRCNPVDSWCPLDAWCEH